VFMASYMVQTINPPRNVPMLSEILTREEAEAYRKNLIETKGVKESDVWILRVEQNEVA
jgi:hypothetical protein